MSDLTSLLAPWSWTASEAHHYGEVDARRERLNIQADPLRGQLAFRGWADAGAARVTSPTQQWVFAIAYRLGFEGVPLPDELLCVAA